MKKSDIAMTILIAALSMGAAYFVAGAIPGLKDQSKPDKVKMMEKIDPKIVQLDKTVFASDAINPTVKVVIGDPTTPSGANPVTPATPNR